MWMITGINEKLGKSQMWIYFYLNISIKSKILNSEIFVKFHTALSNVSFIQILSDDSIFFLFLRTLASQELKSSKGVIHKVVGLNYSIWKYFPLRLKMFFNHTTLCCLIEVSLPFQLIIHFIKKSAVRTKYFTLCIVFVSSLVHFHLSL